MELNDTLRVPLAPAVVREALEDLALLRASFDHCESFEKLAHGEFALTITVPLGPLRARYDVRAHSAGEQGDAQGLPRRLLNFKARADGLGALRGQVELVLLREQGDAEATRIDYVVWATASGPLAELPARQIENALREWTDDFFREFSAVVQAKHGLVPNRARTNAPRRQHVFLRPASLMAAAKRPLPHLGGALSGRAASVVHHRESGPLSGWAWAAIVVFVALLLYAARWINGA
ncbi:carbon monoxide dehydrogenase [Burkholderia sp. AU19243]|uniref:CoxG family protein n=1 Tax=Burkholderia TaxID=32008 RepID=UPI00084227AE|nr:MULTISPECIES: SRPBCC domain-containing protein [Burkholderia]MBR8146088.1 carbon monoxide dehydrogenase [Burkholderia vietnamiensis]AOK05244.1 carbon monoxide dehydrogenase [Burkholderia latens]MBR8362923.1 carbon monoxide dehydrogenase [Burkholderia sp. AU19243]MCA8312278.1 carbon monoxide dehydrogenase [Burkholderia sp. AU28942]QTO44720.1 carbon monoxide dehydrogenase [Burkholderia latens]